MTQMAVWATYVIRGTGMMPVADDAGGKNQQHDQRQRNPEYPNRLPHGHFVAAETTYNPRLGNSSVIQDVGKALSVTHCPNR
jgi:hypothetical protein